MLASIQNLRPAWPEPLVRLVATAVAVQRMRLSDAHLREHVLLLWMMQGGRFLRSHKGQYATCIMRLVLFKRSEAARLSKQLAE